MLVKLLRAKLSVNEFLIVNSTTSMIGRRHKSPASQLLPIVGADKFAEISLEEVVAISRDCANKTCLIAIGAGTLQSRATRQWLRNYMTVAITAPAEEVYQRDRLRSHRTLNIFKQVEYSEYRMSIYNSAAYQHQVNGLSFEQASDRLFKLLSDRILPEHIENEV